MICICRNNTPQPYLGSSPFPVLGSEYFLKKMSSLLTTMETRQEGHSQSPSGQEAAPPPLSCQPCSVKTTGNMVSSYLCLWQAPSRVFFVICLESGATPVLLGRYWEEGSSLGFPYNELSLDQLLLYRRENTQKRDVAILFR